LLRNTDGKLHKFSRKKNKGKEKGNKREDTKTMRTSQNKRLTPEGHITVPKKLHLIILEGKKKIHTMTLVCMETGAKTVASKE